MKGVGGRENLLDCNPIHGKCESENCDRIQNGSNDHNC